MSLANPLDTPLKVANAALATMGADPITAFADGSAAGYVLENAYEFRARETLGSARWRFAMKQIVVARLVGAPLETWTATYQMPADTLLVHSLSVSGAEIPFEFFGQTLYCNAGVDDVVVADYGWRVPEAQWPANFTGFFVDYLAASLMASLTREVETAVLAMRMAEQKRRRVISLEAQSRTTDKIDTGAFIKSRRR